MRRWFVLAVALAGCSGEAMTEDAGASDAIVARLDAGCDEAADCDDGIACNGAERCVEGSCEPGEPPLLDDGVSCTTDRCDEETGEVVHEPDDGLCADLDEPAICDEQRVVATVGRCEAEGCVAVEEVEDCAAVTGLPRCAGTAEGDDLAHLSSGGCVEGACVTLASPCTPSEPECADGMRTTYAPSCDASGGCDEVASTEACSSPADRCLGPVHVTYTPSCADARDCGTAAESMETCPTPPAACVSNVYTVYAPSCDASDGCGSAVVSETSCDDMEPAPTCAGRTVCTCSTVTEGCNCTFSPVFGCPLGPANGRCLDANTLETSTTTCVNHETGYDCVPGTQETECEHGCCPDSVGTPPFTSDACCPDSGV